MKHKHKHPWDETLVIMVMVVSALCVLILLASYISSAGQAAKLPYNQATIESLLSMMNSANIGSDSGKMICNVECTRRYEVCIVAHDGNKLVDCGARITGNYTCLCSNPSRVVGVIPKVEQIVKTDNYLVGEKNNNLCIQLCKKDETCVNGKCVSSYKKKELPGVTEGKGYESTTLPDEEYQKYLDLNKELNSLSDEDKAKFNALSEQEQQKAIESCLGSEGDCVKGFLKNPAALIGGDTPIDTIPKTDIPENH